MALQYSFPLHTTRGHRFESDYQLHRKPRSIKASGAFYNKNVGLVGELVVCVLF